MTRVRGVPGFARARLITTVCLGLMCATLAGCGDGGSSEAEASSAPPSTGAYSPSPSPSTWPPDPTPTVDDYSSETEEETEDPVIESPEEDEVYSDTGSDASELWGTEYSGTAEISVDIYDYCSSDGSRQLADSESYSMDGTLNLSSPRSGGGETEDNPFSLLFAAGDPSETGAVSFWSSAVSTTSGQDLSGNPRDPEVLMTYWDMTWYDGELDAELTDPHTEEAVALNLFNWPSPIVACRSDLGQLPGAYPHALDSGTTFEGPLDSSSAYLTAAGVSTDGLVEFSIEFEGTA
ncbi:hypothetical protein ACIP79_26430 [Streptomyces sp. NPDC088747]|uniref:hypothetical protein n=1 Tax=Streptomyces sp. NPDC088747 TaxID=3365886 RepID=UPI0038021A04